MDGTTSRAYILTYIYSMLYVVPLLSILTVWPGSLGCDREKEFWKEFAGELICVSPSFCQVHWLILHSDTSISALLLPNPLYLIVSLKPQVTVHDLEQLALSDWYLWCSRQWSLMDHLGDPGVCLILVLYHTTVAIAMVISEWLVVWLY